MGGYGAVGDAGGVEGEVGGCAEGDDGTFDCGVVAEVEVTVCFPSLALNFSIEKTS